MSFTSDDLKKLKQLCRIDCSEAEEKELLIKLQSTIDQIDLLSEVNTENVKECCHVLESMNNVMRDDEIGEVIPRDKLLSNAPDQVGGMVRVPPVIKF